MPAQMVNDKPRLSPWLLAAVAYAGVTAAITWPLLIHLGSTLPHDAFDPAFTTWVLWWNAHTLPLTAAWWSPTFFWPMPGALALSEHLLGISLITTPLQWLGCSPVTSYNIAFLVSFPLVALAAHALLVALTERHDAGFIGGCAVAFSPYRMAQLAHIQVLWLFGVPLALLALHRYTATRRPPWLVVFAAAFVVQALSNGYLALLFPILALLWMAWFARDLRAFAAIAAASALAAVALLPVAVGYYRWQNALSLERRYDEIESFSADVTSLLAASPAAALWSPLSRFAHTEDEFFPGALVALLVVVGAMAAFADRADPAARMSIRIVRAAALAGAAAAAGAALLVQVAGPWTFPPHAGWTLVSVASPQKPFTIALAFAIIYALSSDAIIAARRARSAFVFYALAAGAMFVCALGPNPRFNGTPVLFHAPYWWLLHLPGFSGLRVPARFGTLFQFCVSVAAALAFARFTAGRTARVRAIAAVAAGAVIVAEAWPRTKLADLPPPLAIAADAADAAVLELPLGTVEGDTAALFRAMTHRLPTINGYSGYVPIHYELLRRALELGDARVLDPLAGDRDLIVAVRDPDAGEWSPLLLRHPRASVIAHNGGWHIYRIARGRSHGDDRFAGERLPIASVTASIGQPDSARMLDGNVATRWNSGQRQVGGEEVVVDLGDERFVTGLELDLGGLPIEFPRQLIVECAGADRAWQICWEGSTAAAALSGALRDPRTSAMTLRVDRGAVRWLRLRQTGSDPLSAWAIAELSVYGSMHAGRHQPDRAAINGRPAPACATAT